MKRLSRLVLALGIGILVYGPERSVGHVAPVMSPMRSVAVAIDPSTLPMNGA